MSQFRSYTEQLSRTKIIANNKSLFLGRNYPLVTRALLEMIPVESQISCFFFFNIVTARSNQPLYHICFFNFKTKKIERHVVTNETLENCLKMLCSFNLNGTCMDATEYLEKKTSKMWWVNGFPSCTTQEFFFNFISHTFATLDPTNKSKSHSQPTIGKKTLLEIFFQELAVLTFNPKTHKLVLLTSVNYAQLNKVLGKGGKDIQRLMQKINFKQDERSPVSTEDPVLKWVGDKHTRSEGINVDTPELMTFLSFQNFVSLQYHAYHQDYRSSSDEMEVEPNNNLFSPSINQPFFPQNTPTINPRANPSANHQINSQIHLKQNTVGLAKQVQATNKSPTQKFKSQTLNKDAPIPDYKVYLAQNSIPNNQYLAPECQIHLQPPKPNIQLPITKESKYYAPNQALMNNLIYEDDNFQKSKVKPIPSKVLSQHAKTDRNPSCPNVMNDSLKQQQQSLKAPVLFAESSYMNGQKTPGSPGSWPIPYFMNQYPNGQIPTQIPSFPYTNGAVFGLMDKENIVPSPQAPTHNGLMYQNAVFPQRLETSKPPQFIRQFPTNGESQVSPFGNQKTGLQNILNQQFNPSPPRKNLIKSPRKEATKQKLKKNLAEIKSNFPVNKELFSDIGNLGTDLENVHQQIDQGFESYMPVENPILNEIYTKEWGTFSGLDDAF